MSTAPRRAEFFALEANEYLADLEPLATAHDRPDAERLVRGARALRGAALMAGLGTFARAAAGLEAVARQVRDHALAWEPNAREAWVEGLGALRALVARAPHWEAVDDRQALTLAERFDQVISGRPARSTAPAPPALTPGVRAFIARESALIAGSLEEASRALAPVPPAEALAGVLERMRSLRGLGASAELSPLPELLDAMEVATRALLADVAPPPNVAAVFADAAHALAAIARAVADAGVIAPPPELESIAKRLLAAYASESDVVSIDSLAPDGAESVVVVGEAPPPPPDGDPVPVELVSVGDHLVLVADTLSRPSSAAARDLRLFVLHRTLAAMPSRSSTGRFLAPLAEAIGAAIGHQMAVERPEAFIAMVRGCGRFLVEAAASTDRLALTRRRDAIATSLTMVGLGAPAGGFEPRLAAVPPAIARPEPVAPAAAPAPLAVPVLEAPASPAVTTEQATPELPSAPIEPIAAPAVAAERVQIEEPPPVPSIVSIDMLAPDEVFDVVPISALQMADEPDVVPIESLLEPEELDVVSIDSLAPDIADDVVPIESLAPDAAPVIPAVAPGRPSRLEQAYESRGARRREGGGSGATLDGLIAVEIVPMSSLLYQGIAALQRAEEVRIEISALLAEPAVSVDRLRPCLHELLDLVPLARAAA